MSHREEILYKVRVDGMDEAILDAKELLRLKKEIERFNAANPGNRRTIEYVESERRINMANADAINREAMAYERLAKAKRGATVSLGDLLGGEKKFLGSIKTDWGRTPETKRIDYTRELEAVKKSLDDNTWEMKARMGKINGMQVSPFLPFSVANIESQRGVGTFGRDLPRMIQYLQGAEIHKIDETAEKAIRVNTAVNSRILILMDNLRKYFIDAGGARMSTLPLSRSPYGDIQNYALASLSQSIIPMQAGEIAGGTARSMKVGNYQRISDVLPGLMKLGLVSRVLRDVELHPITQILSPSEQFRILSAQTMVGLNTLSPRGKDWSKRYIGDIPGWKSMDMPLDYFNSPMSISDVEVTWAPKPSKGGERKVYATYGDSMIEVTPRIQNAMMGFNSGVYNGGISDTIAYYVRKALGSGGLFTGGRLSEEVGWNKTQWMNASSDKWFVLRNPVITSADAWARLEPSLDRFANTLEGKEAYANAGMDYWTSGYMRKNVPSNEYAARQLSGMIGFIERDAFFKNNTSGYRGIDSYGANQLASSMIYLLMSAIPNRFGRNSIFSSISPDDELKNLYGILGNRSISSAWAALNSNRDVHMDLQDYVDNALVMLEESREGKNRSSPAAQTDAIYSPPRQRSYMRNMPGGELPDVFDLMEKKDLESLGLGGMGRIHTFPGKERTPVIPLPIENEVKSWETLLSKNRYDRARSRVTSDIGNYQFSSMWYPWGEGKNVAWYAWDRMLHTFRDAAMPNSKYEEDIIANNEKLRKWGGFNGMSPRYYRDYTHAQTWKGYTESWDELATPLADIFSPETLKRIEESTLYPGEGSAIDDILHGKYDVGEDVVEGTSYQNRGINRLEKMLKMVIPEGIDKSSIVKTLLPIVAMAGISAGLGAMGVSGGLLGAAGILPFMMGASKELSREEIETRLKESTANILDYKAKLSQAGLGDIVKEALTESLKDEVDRSEKLKKLLDTPPSTGGSSPGGNGNSSNGGFSPGNGGSPGGNGGPSGSGGFNGSSGGNPFTFVSGDEQIAGNFMFRQGGDNVPNRYIFRSNLEYAGKSADSVRNTLKSMNGLAKEFNGEINAVAKTFMVINAAGNTERRTLLSIRGMFPLQDEEGNRRMEASVLKATHGANAFNTQYSAMAGYVESTKNAVNWTERFANVAPKIRGLSWTFTMLSMSSLGVFFSMMSIVNMLSQGISLVFGPLKDIGTLTDAYAKSIAHASVTGIDMNEIMKESDVTLGDMVQGWRWAEGISADLTMGFALLGSKMLTLQAIGEDGLPIFDADGKAVTVAMQIASAIEKVIKWLSDPATTRTIGDILTNLADILPDVVAALPAIISIGGGIATAKVPYSGVSMMEIGVVGAIIAAFVMPITGMAAALLKLVEYAARIAGLITGAGVIKTAASAAANAGSYTFAMTGEEAAMGAVGATSVSSWARTTLPKLVGKAALVTGILGLAEPAGGPMIRMDENGNYVTTVNGQSVTTPRNKYAEVTPSPTIGDNIENGGTKVTQYNDFYINMGANSSIKDVAGEIVKQARWDNGSYV